MKERVQGFVTGAAVMAGLMLGLPLMTAPQSPSEDLDAIAAMFDVEIVWTDESPCKRSEQRAIGCFFAPTPSLIYVSPNLADETRDTVLHELGHVMQWRVGLPRSEEGADAFGRWYLWSSRGDYLAP